ncbi:hypothetical protein C1Y63_11370 [Corynebacterium sp. 13CS0277]|uniref:hypothetical protein n=1 Tax=Corynebacterium sp. 13CS0277 TaxID=2071994 RepID=UPI000D02F568|nr:hypothetical protein [Corynebacterium sp. 13CS0277]PRQ10480.1 hypothetical protein C1Y63_11370 [Corynebacterium sp. 13CS0277]
MIPKLAVSSVVRGAGSWLSLIVTAVTLAVVLTLNIALIVVGAGAAGEAQQAYVTMGGAALGFSVLTGLVSFATVVGICVRGCVP